MASVTVTVTSGLPDGEVTGTPSVPTGDASTPEITGAPGAEDVEDPMENSSQPSLTNSSSSPSDLPTGDVDDVDANMQTQDIPQDMPTGGSSTQVSSAQSSLPTGAVDDGEMNAQVMPGGTLGSIPEGVVDPLPHIMPGTGEPQTDPSDSSTQGDSFGATTLAPSASQPSTSPMASPVMKRHWWRV